MCVKGSFLCHTDAEKFTQAQAVINRLCDTPFTVESFKVFDKNHSEINLRSDARSAKILVRRSAHLFGISIKTKFIKNLIELGVKRMDRRFGDLIGGNEQHLLFRFAFAKCHGWHDHEINLESFVADCHFFNGLLWDTTLIIETILAILSFLLCYLFVICNF